VVLTVWRLYYFGYPLPNTYYAKVSADWLANFREGMLYMGKFLLLENPALLLASSLLGVWLATRHRHIERTAGDPSLVILAVIALVNLVVPILSGGDHFVLGRPFQPLVPMTWAVFILLFFRLVQLDLPGLGRSGRELLPALAFLFAAALMPARFHFYDYGRRTAPLQKEFALAAEGRALGEALNRFFEPLDTLPTVGVICAGGVARTYRGPAMDLLGLNYPAMAHADRLKPGGRPKNHASFSRAVFYRRPPDLFLTTAFVTDTISLVPFAQRPGIDDLPASEAVGHIYRDPEFLEIYQSALVKDRSDGPMLDSYFRKDFLSALSRAGYQVLPENFSRPR
jgi:arabinofuranosyltransferase